MGRLRLRTRRWLAVALVLVSLLGFTLLVLHRPTPQSSSREQAPLRRELSVSLARNIRHRISPRAFPAEAPPLRVGVQLKNVYNLQLDSQIFSADGWYWLSWNEELNTILEQERLKPAALLDFLNQVESWDARIEPETDGPQRTDSGTYYQVFRFSGRFYIDVIDEHRSPFSKVRLQVVMEARPESFSLSKHAVRLLPDPEMKVLVGNYGELSGYHLERGWIEETTNTYRMSVQNNEETFSQLIVNVLYASEPWTAFTKWVLPLLIVMTIVLLAPSLESSLGDMRLAIPSTALLTLVFMQQTYKSELPAIPYLTFLDELYTYSYLVALGLFVLFLWSSNKLEAAPAEQKQAIRLSINRIDSICQWSALGGLILVGVLAWNL